MAEHLQGFSRSALKLSPHMKGRCRNCCPSHRKSNLSLQADWMSETSVFYSHLAGIVISQCSTKFPCLQTKSIHKRWKKPVDALGDMEKFQWAPFVERPEHFHIQNVDWKKVTIALKPLGWFYVARHKDRHKASLTACLLSWQLATKCKQHHCKSNCCIY